jgi:hypothetical protein
MSPLLERVAEIAVSVGLANANGCRSTAAVHQDLGITGDEGEAFVEALCAEFGDWIAEWPWERFVDFNEPPADLGPRIWKFLRLPNPETAFPGYTQARLELGHIAVVIKKGQWFDP